MNTHPLDEIVDVVVVGTGAGGGPLLAELARAGLRVVALESGPQFDPLEHTPDETDAVTINWMQERLSGGGTPTAFGPNNSGRGVGGSLLHWGAFTPRPDADDLTLRAGSSLGEDWPIPHAELIAYVERAERQIGVSGPTPYPWDPGRRYDLPPPPRNASAEMMLRGAAAVGLRATDAPAAVLTRARADGRDGAGNPRAACTSCGSCHQGCRIGAKGGTDRVHLPDAVAHGAEIRAGAHVVDIETGADGRVAAVVYRSTDAHGGEQEHRQRCAALVLAAGGVETPRLLLHTGLANGSGQVGANFMAHGAVQVWGRFEDPFRSYRGYPSSAITEDTRRPEGADFVGGYLIQSLGVAPLTYATALTRGAGLWGAELMAALETYPHLGGVGINAECLPSPDNRLTLSPTETDAHGVPLARIDFTAGANEEAIDAHAVGVMRSIVEAAGGRDLRVLPRTAHTIGTARMGRDPDTSVVDPDGRSHEIDNLWICDNSVFPSSLIANPALTILALSLRTAEKLLAS